MRRTDLSDPVMGATENHKKSLIIQKIRKFLRGIYDKAMSIDLKPAGDLADT
jgi:hypothetical protein